KAAHRTRRRECTDAKGSELGYDFGLFSNVHRGRLLAGGHRERRSSGAALVHSLDLRAELAEALVDSLVAALDLADVVDGALALGAQRGKQHRHAGSTVGR